MDGFELCDEIKTEYIGAELDLPFITGLSSQSKNDVQEQIEENGMNDFIEKPASKDQIKGAIIAGLDFFK